MFSHWSARPIRPALREREKTFEEFVEEQVKVDEITKPKQEQVKYAACGTMSAICPTFVESLF